MKKLIALLLALVMVLGLAACGAKEEAPAAAPAAPAEDAAPVEESAPVAEVIEIDFGHSNAVGSPIDDYVVWFAELCAEYSDGRIKVNNYPAGQLGAALELQDAVQMGSLDMCMGDSSLMSNLLPELAILNLPMLITSYDHAAAVYDSASVDALEDKLAEEYNIRVLEWTWNGFRHLITKTPITSLADCKGIKLRSPEADIYVNTFSIMGFNPTPIAWGDTYSGISSGVADGSDTTLEGMYTSDFHSLCDYICLSGHMFSVNSYAINADLWESLSAEDQEIIMKAAQDAAVRARASAIEDEDGFKTLLTEAGVTFTEFENQQEIVDAYMNYWSETADACEGGAELLAEIIDLA